jgi:hypothetical protein
MIIKWWLDQISDGVCKINSKSVIITLKFNSQILKCCICEWGILKYFYVEVGNKHPKIRSTLVGNFFLENCANSIKVVTICLKNKKRVQMCQHFLQKRNSIFLQFFLHKRRNLKWNIFFLSPNCKSFHKISDQQRLVQIN